MGLKVTAKDVKELQDENNLLLARPVTFLKAGTTRIKLLAPEGATKVKDCFVHYTNYSKYEGQDVKAQPAVMFAAVILKHPDDKNEENEKAVRYLSVKPDALAAIIPNIVTGNLLADSGFTFDLTMTRVPKQANKFSGQTVADEFDATNVKWPALSLNEAAKNAETSSYNWAYGIKETVSKSDETEDDDELPF